MAKPAISKVEDRLAEALRDHAALAGLTIVAEADKDVASKPGTITVFTTGYSVAQFEELGQTLHTARIEFEPISGPAAAGTVSRRNQEIVAHIVGALAADRTLGGMVQDIQEIDVAPVEANGRDHAAASLQCEVTFFTPRDDWFTILGPPGVTF